MPKQPVVKQLLGSCGSGFILDRRIRIQRRERETSWVEKITVYDTSETWIVMEQLSWSGKSDCLFYTCKKDVSNYLDSWLSTNMRKHRVSIYFRHKSGFLVICISFYSIHYNLANPLSRNDILFCQWIITSKIQLGPTVQLYHKSEMNFLWPYPAISWLQELFNLCFT